jgi:tetratricopeptide (TPR) repeat protein
MSVYAYAEAASHLERCLAVQEVLDPDDKAKPCDLLLALGEAIVLDGEPIQAVEDVAERAYQFADQLADVNRLTSISRFALDSHFSAGLQSAFHTESFKRWVDRAAPGSLRGTVERMHADWARGEVALAEGRYHEGQGLIYETLDDARQLGDAKILIRLAGGASMLRFPPARWREAFELAEAARKVDNGNVEIQGSMTVYHAAIRHGDSQRAEQALQYADGAAQRTHAPYAQVRNLSLHSIDLFIGGALEAALSQLDELDKRQGMGIGGVANTISDVSSVPPLLFLGRFDEALMHIEARGLREGFEVPWSAPQRALVMAMAGRLAESRNLVRELVEKLDPTTNGEFIPSTVLCLLLYAGVETRDTSVAALIAPLLGVLPPCAHMSLHFPFSPTRILGNAAVLLGRPEDGRRCYNEALEVCEKARFRPEIALTRLGLAELLFEHYPDERDEAIEHLDFAIGEFRAMKMQPSLERALRHRGLLKA